MMERDDDNKGAVDETPTVRADETEPTKRCGIVTLAGQPNVGKSTMMNALVGEKLAIVSPKPQTTRDQIRGILTLTDTQVIFIDTPGVHRARSPLNRAMVAAAVEALETVDLVVLVVDAPRAHRGLRDKSRGPASGHVPSPAPSSGPESLPLDGRIHPEDRKIIRRLRQHGCRWIVAINKVDAIKKRHLLPIMEVYGGAPDVEAVVPVSALTQDGLDILIEVIRKQLPLGEPLYGADDLTDRSLRFLASELIREQVFLQIQQEVPYGVAIEIEVFDEHEDVTHIQAVVCVERKSQRGILIGRAGTRMKSIASIAREQIQDMLERKVFLEIHVRVEKDWSQQLAMLRRFGYGTR